MSTDMSTGTRLTTEAPEVAGKHTHWMIDPHHSFVEFGVKHMMFTTVKGRFTGITGVIHCEDEDDPTTARVEATIETATIDTSEANRDAHLRSPDFLDAEQFPAITFKSKRVERRGADEFRMTGDLTIRDVSREIGLEMTYNGRGKNPFGKEVAGFTAETTINRKDFGLKWNVALETGGMLVGDKLDILIEIQAVKEE
jgi:polyisoprenoid-binding protein YceI